MTASSVQGQPRLALSLAEKLTWLFEHVRRDNGRRHSKTAVAAFVAEYTGETCSRGYIALLANGQKTNPTLRVVEALAAFFDISPAYFVDDEQAARIQNQLEVVVALRDGDIRAIALHEVTSALDNAGTLSVEDLHAIHDLIRTLST